jgi:hypothetical protein
MRRQIILAVVTACAATSIATRAPAQNQQDQQACTHDAFQFCGEAIPDRDKVFQCLAAKRDVISATCRTVMAPYLPAATPVQKAAVRSTTVRTAKSMKTGTKISTKTGSKTTKTSIKSAGAGKGASIRTATITGATDAPRPKVAIGAQSTKSTKTTKTAKSKAPLDIRPR